MTLRQRPPSGSTAWKTPAVRTASAKGVVVEDRGGTTSSAPSPATLTLDVGGTRLKASVLDEKGAILHDRVGIDTSYPCPPMTSKRLVSSMRVERVRRRRRTSAVS